MLLHFEQQITPTPDLVFGVMALLTILNSQLPV